MEAANKPKKPKNHCLFCKLCNCHMALLQQPNFTNASSLKNCLRQMQVLNGAPDVVTFAKIMANGICDEHRANTEQAINHMTVIVKYWQEHETKVLAMKVRP